MDPLNGSDGFTHGTRKQAAPGTFTFRDERPEYFWDRLSGLVPVNHAMWRACEASAMAGLSVRRPVLDIGCGDGLFASLMFSQPVDIGVDLHPHRVLRARERGVYVSVQHADATALPFADESIGAVFSNCVLEHIPDIDRVCVEVSRVLAAGGHFVFTVPTDDFTRLLLLPRLLRSLGLGFVGERYSRRLNRAFLHFHTDSPDCWRSRLGRAGLTVERCEIILSPALEATWDALMPVAALQLFLRRLRPRRPFPFRAVLSHVFRPWIVSQLAQRDLPVGGNMVIVARKELR